MTNNVFVVMNTNSKAGMLYINIVSLQYKILSNEKEPHYIVYRPAVLSCHYTPCHNVITS